MVSAPRKILIFFSSKLLLRNKNMQIFHKREQKKKKKWGGAHMSTFFDILSLYVRDNKTRPMMEFDGLQSWFWILMTWYVQNSQEENYTND